MSHIYFHSQHGDAEISGRERGWAGSLCSQLLNVALELNTNFIRDTEQHPLTPFLPERLKSMWGRPQYEMIKTWLAVGGIMEGSDLTLPDGTIVTPFTLSLNTAFVMGNDPIKLMARLHGQCEIHTYVEGKNRSWLAGIIEQGLKAGVMRPDVHWEDVITLLRSRDDSPVVTSYSVTDGFPNRTIAGWEPTRKDDYGEPDYDQWYELPEDEQWRLALEGLRATRMRELKPEDWATYYFDGGETGFTVMQQARALQSQK